MFGTVPVLSHERGDAVFMRWMIGKSLPVVERRVAQR